MMNWIIVVNDNGELKTVTQEEFEAVNIRTEHGFTVGAVINEVLDHQHILRGEGK